MAYITYKRPALLTLICIIGFIFPVLAGLGAMFSPETRRMGDFFPALLGLLVAARFISYVGIWYMKRWGADVLLISFGATVIKNLLNDDMGFTGIISLVWHLFAIVVLAFQYRKMDRNL